MFKGFSISETIAASPAKVWAHLTDFENANVWMPRIKGLISISDGARGVGTHIDFDSSFRLDATEISVFEPEKELVLVAFMEGLEIIYTYRLSPHGDDTTITLSIHANAKGVWRAIKPLVMRGVKRTESKQLWKLRNVVEEQD